MKKSIENNCNLLLNVGPMADGSVHPNHVKILLELGDKIRKEGYPTTGSVREVESNTDN